MAIQTRRQSLTQARLLFNQQGAVPGGMVAEPILRSWRRCADLGFDMRGLRPAEPLTPGRAARGPRAQQALRRMSDPVMAELRKRAHGQGGLVILSDSRGLVLDCGGDLDFAQRASRIALMPGSPGTRPRLAPMPSARRWSRAVPSSCTGRALFRAQPHPDLRGGAGVRQPGRILGVLDLSSQAGGIRPDALALVRAAVDQIEHRLFAQAHERDTVLRLHADPAGLGRRARRCWPSGATCWSGPTGWRCGRWNSATALGVYRHEDLFEDALTHAPDATGRVQARNGAVYHARLSLPPSPAPRVVPAPERSQPRAVAPAPAAVSLDAAALDALGRSVHLMDAGVSILLQGETGAGKEVFARQMHARSRRAAGPFVAVNRAALPESLIESELFGYEDGASPARAARAARAAAAGAWGVLFLDEIGDMPLACSRACCACCRSARYRRWRGAAGAGGFRAAVRHASPAGARGRGCAGAAGPVFPHRRIHGDAGAARERTDLRELLRTLWNAQGAATALPPVVERALASYAWPGNYRQLVSVLRTLRVLAGPSGVAGLSMLPEEIQRGALMRRGMRRASRGGVAAQPAGLADAAIREALAAHGGNVSRAARVLGVHRSTLYRRVAALEAARAERP